MTSNADLLLQARDAIDRFDGKQALTLLATHDEQESADYLACLIEAQSLARDFAAAETTIALASSRYPQEVGVHMAAGMNAMHTRDYALAERRFTQAAQVRAGYAPAYNNLGMVYEYLHRQADARQAYAQAISHDAALAPAYRNLGRMAELGGRLDEAKQYYEQGRARTAAAEEFGRLLEGVGNNFAPAEADAAGATVHENMLAADIGSAALRHLPPDRKFAMLDLICGSGIAGDLLWRRTGVMVGVDPRVPLLHQAQARGIYYDLKDQRPADFLRTCKRGETDLITANCAFVDQGDLLPVFLNLYAVLSPGGLLVTVFPTQTDNIGFFSEGSSFSHDPRYVLERADFEGMQLLERADYTHDSHPGIDRTYTLLVFAKPAA
ncbi:MAG: methyltransferase [Betaproteobacteria bacterium]|nr:methyltransferase [Betaproteobacteria bacterium]